MLKAFHMADLHLGCEFSHLDKSKAQVRKNESRLSFLSQINNAYNKGARVFFISGDLFDSRPFHKDDTDILKEAFSNHIDCNFFLCLGNHDYICDDYTYLSDEFGENVYIFNQEIGMYEFDDYRVYGVSFCDVFQENSLLDGFVATDDDKINVMVIHGDLASASKYNPILTSMIEKSGLDYLALGHVHMYSGMNKSGNTYYCYPGTHEGKGFDELGEKGGVYLEIEKERMNYEFICGQIRKYVEIHINAENIPNSSVLTSKIVSEISDAKDLYKIVIEGEVSKDLILNSDTLAKTLDEYAFFVKIYDETRLRINPEDYLDENSLLGGFVREVKEKIDNNPSENEHWMKVLKKGFQLLK